MLDRRDYAAMTAVEMADKVRRADICPVELTEAALAAIAETNDQLNAWSEVLAESALRQAEQLAQEARRGQWRGPLHGVPVGIKDLFLTAGVATRKGSVLSKGFVPAETAPSVQRLLVAGAVMVGKNTTPEFGWKASSSSPLYGVTRNPWDPAKTAGGSSSGSASAVAAGHVPISLGSDGGGSVRIPASFCGIFAMKASLGRVPTWPLSPSEHLSHAGPMTRTVEDYAFALDVIKGPDPRDPGALPDDGISYLARLSKPLGPIKCRLVSTLFGRTVDPQIADVIAAAFNQVRSIEGVLTEKADLCWHDPLPIFEGLWRARGGLSLELATHNSSMMDPGLVKLILSAERISIRDHLLCLQERAAFCRQVFEEFAAFDFLLMPMVPIVPFAAEADGPPDMNPGAPVPWASWTPFSYPFNLTGQPAASIHCGWTTDGMPVGLQVVGRRFEDVRVLQLCYAMQKAFDCLKQRPRIFSGQ